jgi:hypothetical protein
MAPCDDLADERGRGGNEADGGNEEVVVGEVLQEMRLPVIPRG